MTVLLRVMNYNYFATCGHAVINADLGDPDSFGREFRAVARSATVFFVKQSLQKDINLRF